MAGRAKGLPSRRISGQRNVSSPTILSDLHLGYCILTTGETINPKYLQFSSTKGNFQYGFQVDSLSVKTTYSHIEASLEYREYGKLS
jgi:hypothetical protein